MLSCVTNFAVLSHGNLAPGGPFYLIDEGSIFIAIAQISDEESCKSENAMNYLKESVMAFCQGKEGSSIRQGMEEEG